MALCVARVSPRPLQSLFVLWWERDFPACAPRPPTLEECWVLGQAGTGQWLLGPDPSASSLGLLLFLCCSAPLGPPAPAPPSPGAPSALETTINTPHYKKWRALFFFFFSPARAFSGLCLALKSGPRQESQNSWGGGACSRQEMSRMHKIRHVSLIYGRARLRRVDMCIYKCADRSLNIQTHFMIVLCPSSG